MGDNGSGVTGKRRYTAAEKVKIVEEALLSGNWQETARAKGIALSSLLDWKRRVIRGINAPKSNPSWPGHEIENQVRRSSTERLRKLLK